MNQTETKKKGSVLSLIMFILSLILIAGVKTLFRACTDQVGGEYMLCHWAEQTIFVIAIAMAVIALMSVIIGDGRAKAAYCLAEIPLAAATAFTPQYIIPLCTGADMRCKSIMQPAVMILSGVIAVIALIGFIVYRVRASSDKKAIRSAAYEEGKASVPPVEVKPVEVKPSAAPPKEPVAAESKPSFFSREEEPIKIDPQNDLNAELFPAEQSVQQEAVQTIAAEAPAASADAAKEEKGFFGKLFK